MDGKLVCLADYEAYAYTHLDKSAVEFIRYGATEEVTLQENCDAVKRYKLRPRVLRDVSTINMETHIQGDTIDIPICIAPSSIHGRFHPDGEIATAKAARRHNTCYVMSTAATVTVEDVTEQTGPGLRWFQLYITRDRQMTLDMVRRAERCGFKAFVLTVDAPVFGRNYPGMREPYTLPPHLRLSMIESSLFKDKSNDRPSSMQVIRDVMTYPQINWDDVRWIREQTKLPLILKGILTAEDALLAVEERIDGIYVSNHGGRQLDSVPATIDVLPEIIAAVDNKCEVYVDGGVRSGLDVLKMLALGARAVFIGRPVLWGLAHKGEEGVHSVLDILKEELRIGMALSGVCNLLEIDRRLIKHQSGYGTPNVAPKL